MGLSRCTECETVEGAWRDALPKELASEGFDSDDEVLVCGECGGVDCRQNIPEHDDYEAHPATAGFGASYVDWINGGSR